MQYKDYYKTLGVDKKATEKEIKTAYRKLARKYHPDVNPGAASTEAKFKDINEAQAVLTDPEKRRKYDTLGPDWEKRFRQTHGQGSRQQTYAYGPGGAASAGDFSDFFETLFGQRGAAGDRPGSFEFDLGSLFGRGKQRQVRTRGQDVEQQIEVSLQDAFTGIERAFTIQTARECPTCSGTGMSSKGACQTCQGTGAVPKTKRLDVKIPPGVREGSRIRVAGEGSSGDGGADAGDLYLAVHVAADPRYRREGDDLYTNVSVPVTTLVLGGDAQVPTLKGELTMTIPAGSQNGRTLRLSGEGMPHLKTGGQGDLYVKLNAILPTDLDSKQRDLFQQLAQVGV